jgi:hypothetical protein
MDSLVKKESDFSESEIQSLKNFVSKGCPGISKVDEVKIFQWFELYMSGKTYDEISTINGDKKDLILYISDKQKWFSKKISYYNDLTSHAQEKIAIAKITAISSITSGITAMSKFHEEIFNKYLKTNDASVLEQLDPKMFAAFMKILESLGKIDSTGQSPEKGGQHTSVNINFNNMESKKPDLIISDAEVVKKEDGPSMVQRLAQYKRDKKKDDN